MVESFADRRADAVGRGVRVARQQRDHVARARPDVGRVDAAVRAHEPVVGLGDDEAVLHPHDPLRLAQDQLDLAWIAVVALSRTRPTSGRGSMVVRSTIAPSAFETTFWVTTRTSSIAERQEVSRRGQGPGDERR